MKNLFGEEIPEYAPAKPKSPIQRYRATVGYRGAGNNLLCCKTCKHLTWGFSGDKKFYKCQLVKITAGAGTDIKLRNICNKFEMIQEAY